MSEAGAGSRDPEGWLRRILGTAGLAEVPLKSESKERLLPLRFSGKPTAES